MEQFMPNDPVMLLSYVNTRLRDQYASLREFCLSEGVAQEELCEKLSGIDYAYDEAVNQFI